MTAGPAACAPAPIVGKIPPSIVPRPIAVSAGHPSVRRRVGPSVSREVHEAAAEQRYLSRPEPFRFNNVQPRQHFPLPGRLYKMSC